MTVTRSGADAVDAASIVIVRRDGSPRTRKTPLTSKLRKPGAVTRIVYGPPTSRPEALNCPFGADWRVTLLVRVSMISTTAFCTGEPSVAEKISPRILDDTACV